MENKRKFIFIGIMFFSVIAIGIYGYSVLLGVGFLDALYMTAITISTVGYGEVAEMSSEAKVFTIFLIFSGLGVAGYGITSIFALFFEGQLKDAWRKKRMEYKIKELKDHYIVCGAGEVGNIVIQQFKENNLEFLVIENNQERVEELKKEGILIINDDATSEDALVNAKIQEAKGLVASLSNDAENVFTVLTARQLNPNIYIVAKAIEKNAYRKLEKAGANNTISPNEIGGRRIAAMVIRPSVISFLDVMTKADDVLIDLEEVKIGEDSDLTGKNLKEAKVPERSGLIVMAIRHKENNKINFNPSSKEVLNVGDVMIVLGKPEQVDLLKKIACDNTKSSIV